MMAAVFGNQGLGQLTAALVSFICAARYKESLQTPTNNCDAECQVALDQSWRILYGLGIVPAIVALYFRLTLPESIRYTLDVEVDEDAAEADADLFVSGGFGSAQRSRRRRPRRAILFPKASVPDFIKHFGTWKGTGAVLLGTSVSWALLDVAFVLSHFHLF